MAREKKEKPPKEKKVKEKRPKKEKPPKKGKGEKEETLLEKLKRQAKIKDGDAQEPEAAAAPPEEGEEGQEDAGKRKPKLILLIAAGVLLLAAVAVVIIFVILPMLSSGDNEPEEPVESSPEPVLYDLPESYQVGEEAVTAVAPIDPNGVQAKQAAWVSYTYTGMSDAGAEVSAYVATLRSAGFSVVDEEFVRTDPPDYTTPEGTVLLAKDLPKEEEPSEEDGGDPAANAGEPEDSGSEPTEGEGEDQPEGGSTSATGDVQPTKGGDRTAGGVKTLSAAQPTDGADEPSESGGQPEDGADEPTESGGQPEDGSDEPTESGDQPEDGDGEPAEGEEEPEVDTMVLKVELEWSEGTMVVTCDQEPGKVTSPAQTGRPATPGASMSMAEAVDYLYTLEPSVLGLSGESMESYRIYALDGAVRVNDQLCMRLSIYSRDNPEQVNDVAGIYLMSRDGTHLYLLDEDAQSVRELKLP